MNINTTVSNQPIQPNREISKEVLSQNNNISNSKNIKNVDDINNIDKSENTTDISNNDNKNENNSSNFEMIKDTLKELSEEFQKQNIDVKISFSFKDEYKYPIIEIVNPKNNEIIRQIPSEDFIKRMKNLDELRGLLFSEKI